ACSIREIWTHQLVIGLAKLKLPDIPAQSRFGSRVLRLILESLGGRRLDLRNLLRLVLVQSRSGLFVPILLQRDAFGFAFGTGPESKLCIDDFRKEFALAFGENLRFRLAGELCIQVLPFPRDRNHDVWVQAVSANISVQDLRIDFSDGLLRWLE